MNGHDRPKRAWESPWFWGIGGCCLGCLAIPLILVTGFGVGMAALVSQGSDVFGAAMDHVREEPAAVQALGEPIERGWLIQGNLSFENDEGEVDMSFPLSGPNGSGRLHVDGTKTGGEWRFRQIVLEMDDGRSIPVEP